MKILFLIIYVKKLHRNVKKIKKNKKKLEFKSPQMSPSPIVNCECRSNMTLLIVLQLYEISLLKHCAFLTTSDISYIKKVGKRWMFSL